MINGLLPEQGKENIEKLKSFLENCIYPNSLTDEAQEFFREVAALKGQSVEETLQEMMAGTRKYLEAINTEIEFKNDIPRDINKYVDKIEKLAAGIESCWDIFSVESHHYFVNTAYSFTKVSSKCNGWQGWLIRFRLTLPSLQQKEDLFGKYKKSFWIIPKGVDRAIELRKSKSTSKLWEKGQYLLNKETEIDNSEKGTLLPYLNLGRTAQEQLEKNKLAMTWAKARMEEIKRENHGKDLSSPVNKTLHITPASKGSGYQKTSINHDSVIADIPHNK
ncbi:MAG: hypothetical protein F6K40_05770 [Okeania sp. SIO3I5]|uniref:hypothetical protein n=1 Tax=Okeania sp. SIO3I5 TaxID=2607805 RepID=UPI0013B6FD26|nr:hypothetical protein [Okeania sp. SIO3I5]NEQ35817.1 hypothetical protein [Okeania sp. SIO3I5]